MNMTFTPWSNTLLYLPLTTDASNKASSWITTTNNWVTFTRVWAINCAYFNWTSNYIKSSNYSFQNWTTVAWIYVTPWDEQFYYLYNKAWSLAWHDSFYSKNSLSISYWHAASATSMSAMRWRCDTWKWVLYVWKKSWSNYTAMVYNSDTPTYITGGNPKYDATSSSWAMYIWCTEFVDTFWKWYISEFIEETKVRTDEEITSYFNSTKWDYGYFVPDYLHWDTQWPCPDGYHIPTSADRNKIRGVYWNTSFSYMLSDLKIWKAWYRDTNTNLTNSWSGAYFWTSEMFSTAWTGWRFALLSSSELNLNQWHETSYALNIRAFKNTPAIPDSTWTNVRSSWDYIVKYNSSLWLISLSSDWWNTWTTIQDKNLWATEVYTQWKTPSVSNCWNFYQFWNNYGFWWSTLSTSSSTVNASAYWPWNYYSNNTYRTASTWDSSKNLNIWWWVTDERPEEPTFSYAWLLRYEESDTEHTNPLKPTQTITIAPAGFPDITETVWSYLNRVASWWQTVEWYNFSKINIVNHHWDIEKEVSESYIPTLEDFEDDNSISFLIQFKQKRIIKKIKKIMNNWQEYRINTVPEWWNVWEVLIKEWDWEKWWSVDVWVIGSWVKNMKVLTKTAFNNLTKKEDDVMYLIWPWATDINITTTSLSFNKIWQQKQIVASVVPDTAIAKWLLYESQNINIVTVDENWLVTCVWTWSTTITIKTEELTISKTINITVDTTNYINVLLVWWWAGWYAVSCRYYFCSHSEQYSASWWWGWWVVECKNYAIPVWSYSVNIWSWWAWWCWYPGSTDYWSKSWWATTFRNLSAAWWSWGTSWNWNNWWRTLWYSWAWYMAWSWWGWWAWWAWCDWTSGSTYTFYWWDWWPWFVSSIPGFQTYRWWWWGWAWTDWWWSGWYWWWWSWASAWNWNWWSANRHWWWGWWSKWSWNWWSWFSWFVWISYPTECWYDIEWWIKWTSWDYTYHCFRSSWTLTVR